LRIWRELDPPDRADLKASADVVVVRRITLAVSKDLQETHDHLIPIERTLDEFAQLRDSLREADADMGLSRCHVIIPTPEQSVSEGSFSLPVMLDSVDFRAGTCLASTSSNVFERGVFI
jgi:hypothetical protein